MTEKLWNEVVPASGLWTADYRIPGLPCRSTAVALPGGGFLVVSPGTVLAESFADEIGEARILLAPNSYHHLGIEAWRRRFRGARVAAAQGAIGRLRKQGHTNIASLEGVRPLLPAGVELLEVPATRTGETWIVAETPEGTAWFVGDAFFNITPTPRSARARLTRKLLKSGPGLAISQLMKWGGLQDRRAFRDFALARITRDAPRILVPQHGDILRSEALASELEALVRARLG